MPSKSQRQHNLMVMCAHNPKHAEGKCPPPEVAAEYVEADKGKSFAAKRRGPSAQEVAVRKMMQRR